MGNAMPSWLSVSNAIQSLEFASPHHPVVCWKGRGPRKIGHLCSNTRLYERNISMFLMFFPPVFRSFLGKHGTSSAHFCWSKVPFICFNCNCQVAWALRLLHGRRPNLRERFPPVPTKTHHQQKTFRVSKGICIYVACGCEATTASTRDYRPLDP